MKKLFIAAIIAMCCITFLLLRADNLFGYAEDEGYAVPAEANIARALSADGSNLVALVNVQYNDIIYSTLTGYYVGENRKKIDLGYPLYTRGGAGLRFFNEENWLVTADVDLFQSFDGLYLSDGVSYNRDMTQADDAEFILLALNNGLYMNAQEAVFENALGKTKIPLNSIMQLGEDAISWFEQKNGTLAYRSEDAVYDATLTIGKHTYNYTDLLDALGLLSHAIEHAENGKPDADDMQEAEETLDRNEPDKEQSQTANAAEAGTSDGRGISDEAAQSQSSGTADKVDQSKDDDAADHKDSDKHSDDKNNSDNSANESSSDNTDSGSTDSNPGENTSDSTDDSSDSSPDEGSGSGSGSSQGTDSGSVGGNTGGGSTGNADGAGSSSTGGNIGGGTSGSTGIDFSGGNTGGSTSGSTGIDFSGGNIGGGTSGSGTGSGTSGGNTDGNTSDSGTSDGNTGGSSGESGGDSAPVAYQKPVVTLSKIEPWSYAIGIEAAADDPSGAIIRGVSYTVYRSVKGSGMTTVDKDGHTIYPASSYEGKFSMLRKSKTGNSQSFALSALQPGQKVYLQYSFRYSAEETGADGIRRYVRKYEYSDLIEIQLPTVEEGDVKAVGADWTVCFAAYSDALEFDDLALKNLSAYDKDAKNYSFENFKLNTLPYVNRLELCLTPRDGGDPVTVVIGSTTLSKAQKEEGTAFVSSSPKLDSNTEYTCTVTAKDRYGNVIGLNAPSDHTVCTRKAAPTVMITEVENITDSLTVQIEVSDPDGALCEGEPLIFTAANTKTGLAAELYGEWDESSISAGGEDVRALELKNPKDKSSYTLKLNSLAFSCLYALEVQGSYAPQPDVEDAKASLDKVENAMLGRFSVYTAALSSGLVSFKSGVSDLLDTSATLTATMTSDTTTDILPLIDEFRVILKDKAGNVINTTALAQEELSEGENYSYDTDEAVVELQAGSYIEPRVVLYGLESQYTTSPWESFLISELPQEDTQTTGGYSSSMQLRIMLPEGSLTNHTDYTFSIQAVVKKSGEEYLIPVSMTNSSFTTKKALPKVEYSDLFLAADVAEFLDLRIDDPDETILNSGAVTVYLYYGSTILSAKQFYANAEDMTLRFDGLISGGEYTLKFIASAYNDADGYGSYQTNYLLATYNLTAGSALSGTLSLQKVKQYLTNNRLTEDTIRDQLSVRRYDETAGDSGLYVARLGIQVQDIKGYLGREGESGAVTLTIERSDSMEQPSYEPYLTEELPLTKNDGGSLSLDIVKLLEELPADNGWRATLSATYQGSTILLDEITFRTDADYVVVSNHKELLAAQKANPYANILVDSDFVQDQNTYTAFYGTIDFQGHAVTRGNGITVYFLYPMSGSRITNLVYDYPEKAYYANPSAASIFGYVFGTVENLIVRTHGQVEIAGSGGLIAYTGVQSNGVLRNFIVQLGGDIISSHAVGSYAAIINGNYGVIENGYIYGKNGAGFVARGAASQSLLTNARDYTTSGTRNIYILLDSWFETQTAGGMLNPSTDGQPENFQGIYAVGDYYQIGIGEAKSYLLPYSALKLVPANANAAMFDRVWALTSRSYEEQTTIHQGTTAKLYDAGWQWEMLGDAFDVEGCVSMGFYPRLELPISMQRYQEYLPLPALGQETVPSVVSDGWADDPYAHELDNGYLKLRFRNDSNLQITRVNIDGLITEVVAQSATKDGLYDVIVRAQVDPDDPSYKSQYTVSSVSYVSTAGVREAKTNYKTTGIEFWKSVGTATEWSAINNHMDWNYKLTADIDFAASGLVAGSITINGGFTVSNTKQFTGKIDGQEHVLGNIKLENMNYPWLFYYINGGELSNLLVENMSITAAAKVNISYSGLVRYDYRGTIENVRLKGCELTGSGQMGLIVGYANRGEIKNCSVVNSILRDSGSDQPVCAGGLVGKNYYLRVEGCYTHDVSISITHSLAVNGVGGLAGSTHSEIRNCYAHGSIEAEGSYVGGIIGTGFSGVYKCWSYVDILQTSGNYAAGLCGQGNGCQNVIALGNVSGAGQDTQRLIATFYNSSSNTKGYAHSGQLCGKLGEDEPGADYVTLLTGEELGHANTWQDEIRLGAEWDYTSVSRGCAPLLLADCENEEWQQQDIPLPGQAGDPTLRLLDALYDENGTYSFQVKAQLEHPGLTTEEILAFYKEGKLTVTLDGMDLSDAAFAESRAFVELSESADSETSLISIGTKGFIKALDSYRLSISYTESSGRTRDLDVMVEYKTSLGEIYYAWWEVKDLDEWNALMPEHGIAGENVRITGVVDFNQKGTSFHELSFNRLVGADDSCGFANLRYEGGDDGGPWIEKVGMELKNLSFTGMNFDFSKTKTAVRTMTGAVLSVGEVSNLTLKNVELVANSYTRCYFGFLSNVSGVIDSVVMEGVTLRDATPTIGGNYSHSGALAAATSSEVHKVTASDIKVDMPKNHNVGGILGCQTVAYNEFYENTIENFSVVGNNSVGALGGGVYARHSYESSAEHGTVTGVTYVGGMFGQFCAYSYTAADHYGWLVSDVTVVASAGIAGGACGSALHLPTARAIVENCTITGTTFVGGLAGQCSGLIQSANDLRITGSTIRNTGTGAVSSGSMGTGGMLGRFTNENNIISIKGMVVRNCTIEGPGYVGGLIGTSTRKSSNMIIQRLFMAEDVTVTATGSGPAGGVFGSAIRVDLRDCACGASVAAKTAAGGIIGQLEPQSNEITAVLTNVYYKGSVTAATDYAGGVVGKLNTGSLKLTDSNMKNVLVAADVRSGGDHGSLWVNNTSNSTGAGTGLIYICEDSLLNGQTAKAITATAAAEGKTIYVAPQRPVGDSIQLLVSANDFRTESFYSSRGFTENAWDYTDLSTFMPYPKNADGSAVAEYAKQYKYENEGEEKAVGILLPTGGSIGEELKVYASGADTVNIETGIAASGAAGGDTADSTTGCEITVNNKKYTPDENGVITLVYDFTTDLTVNDVKYSAADLSRKVMTYGKYWYYIDTDGKIHYGLAVKSETKDTYNEIGTVNISEKAVHLWQGYALTENGALISLNGGATEEGTKSVENFTKITSKPFRQDGSTQVYYDFTLYQGQRIPYRVFLLDGTTYTVSSAQKALYDGVILSAKTEFGATSRYFALLGEDGGTLTAYLSDMKLGNITNKNISHISNSFGYTGTVLLAYYDSGDVVGVDYTTGEEVCSTLSATKSFLTYATRTVVNLAQNGATNMLVSDGSFYDGENVRTELDGDGQDSTSGTAPISDSGSGENGTVVSDGDASGITGTAAGDTAAAETASGSAVAASGTESTGNGTESSLNAGADGAGSASAANGAAPTSGTQSTGNSTESVDSASSEQNIATSGAGNTNKTSLKSFERPEADSPDYEPGSDTTSGSGSDGNHSLATGSANTGSTAANTGVAASSSATSGGSTTAAGNSTAGDSSASTNAGNSKDAATNAADTTTEHSDSEVQTQILGAYQELFGDSLLAYSEKTGQYELLDTQKLSEGEEVKRTDALAEKSENKSSGSDKSASGEKVDEMQKPDGGAAHFSVAWGINRSLDATEQQGFLLIALASGIGIVVLAVLYFKVIRRRKK